jgi:hypothetical protein
LPAASRHLPSLAAPHRTVTGRVAVALAFAAALVYVPVLQGFFGTAALTPTQLAIVAPFPIIVWGADETRRALMRRYHARHQTSLS